MGLRSSADAGLEPRIQTDHGCGSTMRVNGDVPRGLECSHSQSYLHPQMHIRNDAHRRIDVAGAQPGQGIEEQGGADVYVAEHHFVRSCSKERSIEQRERSDFKTSSHTDRSAPWT